MKRISTPLSKQTIEALKAGDQVLLSGAILTARDAAHKKIIESFERGLPLPFEIKDQIIYYVGPCPAKPGHAIGPAGPTTSSRMDKYTPKLLELGLSGMIGKGERNSDVIEAIKASKAVYFGAIGGAAALIAKSITSEKVIAWPELGAEAVRELQVVDFPLFILIDSFGNDLYEINKYKYRK